MPPALPSGTNTDFLIRFELADPGILAQEPAPPEPLMALQGTWYRGHVALKEDDLDTDFHKGHVWAKVFPGTHQDRHLLQIIQENFALPATPVTNGNPQVRMYVGQYNPDQGFFDGHGADNWAWSSGLFTFTLKPEQCPPS
jgi:hypothetical protein